MTSKAFRLLVVMATLLSALSLLAPAQTSRIINGVSEPDPAARARVHEAYGQLPLTFEANQGQADSRVKFLARGQGYSLFLAANEAVLALRIADCGLRNEKENPKLETRNSKLETVLRLRLVGGNPVPEVVGRDEQAGKSHYFIGNDPQQWRTEVPHYARVEYRNVYPGVNLIYHGRQRQLEYDFVVAPGVDPRIIKMTFAGAEKFRIDDQGDLVLSTKGGEIRQHKPVVYQEVNGVNQTVSGRYVRRGRRQVGFEVINYDRSKPLVIDPVLSYSTYLGGNRLDRIYAIAVDSAGNVYVTGQTESSDFPTASPFQATRPGMYASAFVTKLNTTGSALIYSTYLGGNSSETGYGIAVDTTGNAYVTGLTSSANFPTVNPVQSSLRGTYDAFVTKLNASGSSLLYSTYLGGSSYDEGRAIAVDAAGNAYVTGHTRSFDFPTVNPLQPRRGGTYEYYPDAFVTKLNAAGSALVYSTYLGGRESDYGNGIAVDAAGNAYVTGSTGSPDFPTASPLQPVMRGGGDAFVTKLNAAGSALVYSTYLGGSGGETSRAIAVDRDGNAYVTGTTGSRDFPTANPLQPLLGGGCVDCYYEDAFVTKLNSTGSALVYSTYLGGRWTDDGFGIAVDSAGNAYVIGTTLSSDFPLVNPVQPTQPGGSDVFVAKLNASGSALVYSTYLGGSGPDWAGGIAVDPSTGTAYVAGWTYSTDFPTILGTVQPAFRSSTTDYPDGFIARIFPADCLGKPSAQTPSGATASHRPIFTWSAVPGAEIYKVILAPINNPAASQVLGTPTANSWTPTSDIPDGDYIWTVVASSRSCETGPTSDPQLFTIPGTCPLAAPTLLNPMDQSTVSNPVEFRWSSVPGASLYLLVIFDTSGRVVSQQVLSATTFTTSIFAQIYGWLVLPWNSTCGLGPASPTWGFGIVQ